ncbi:MAG: type III-B CRISPR module-associated protein Cmr5 [Ignavibacteria bacterium]|jgi:CRISPR/Cas system CMR-associated protein Cmr5 small subunit
MNQKRIEKLIPLAFEIIDKENEINKKFIENDGSEKKIKSEYKGYINSIGPAIIQAGLIKTIAAFSKKSGSAEGDKYIICELIKRLIIKSGYYGSNENNKDLIDIVIERTKETPTFTRIREEDRIIEAITALKLVFDTFAKSEEKEGA